MLTLFGKATANCIKVQWCLNEIGVDYTHIKTDLLKKETRTPEHKQRHPFGKIPVIKDGDHYIWESNTILRYLGSRVVTPLYPVELSIRTTVDQWMEYVTQQIGRWTLLVYFEEKLAKQYFNRKINLQSLSQNKESLREHLPIFEKCMSDRGYISGNKFTLADIAAGSLMSAWYKTSMADEWESSFPNPVMRIKRIPQLLILTGIITAIPKQAKFIRFMINPRELPTSEIGTPFKVKKPGLRARAVIMIRSVSAEVFRGIP